MLQEGGYTVINPEPDKRVFYIHPVLVEIIRLGRGAFLPPPDITVTEWADSERILPSTSQFPGQYRSSKTPPIAKIQDRLTDPRVEEISVVKSAQVAFTTMLENFMGYTIRVRPRTMLYMAPTIDMAKKFSKLKFDPMIEASPELRKRVNRKKSRDSDNTSLFKRFIGGYIVFVGANSPHGLRMLPISVVISDDIDSIEIGSTKEGDPVARAEKRSQTFIGTRKLVRGSTPGVEGASRIWNHYLQGSMEEWYVPCYHCGQEQTFTFEQVSWDKETDAFGKVLRHFPETAVICCKHCGAAMSESQRYQVILQGNYKAQHPERTKHISFHLNELSSTLSTLETIVKSYLDCFIGDVIDTEKEESFVNTTLGLPYKKNQVEEIDQTGLMQRVESYLDATDPVKNIPNEILFIVSSTDIQKTWIETEVWGVGMHKEMWILGSMKFEGETECNPRDPKSVYGRNDIYLNQDWIRKDGTRLRVIRRFVDSGYKAQVAYDYCRNRTLRGYWVIKGSRNVFAPPLPNKYTMADKQRTKLLTLGVNNIKGSIFARLQIDKAGPKYIHFEESICDFEYFEQLTAEAGHKKTSNGITYIVYEKKNQHLRNEKLDLLVYAIAAAEHVNPNWEALAKKMKPIDVPDEPDDKNESDEKEVEVKPPPVKVERVPKIKSVNKITSW